MAGLFLCPILDIPVAHRYYEGGHPPSCSQERHHPSCCRVDRRGAGGQVITGRYALSVGIVPVGLHAYTPKLHGFGLFLHGYGFGCISNGR